MIGEVKAGPESGAGEFLAEFGQDSADRLTSGLPRGEQLDPHAGGVDLGPDRQRTEIFRGDLQRHDVLALGCPHEGEERFGQLGLEGCRGWGAGADADWNAGCEAIWAAGWGTAWATVAAATVCWTGIAAAAGAPLSGSDGALAAVGMGAATGSARTPVCTGAGADAAASVVAGAVAAAGDVLPEGVVPAWALLDGAVPGAGVGADGACPGADAATAATPTSLSAGAGTAAAVAAGEAPSTGPVPGRSVPPLPRSVLPTRPTLWR